jgi:pimeloyl-ACP methyl ester carboxylesterase
VVRAIDVIKLDMPLVVGHSFAGEEMHVLGARHAGRVAGLVYIDAAFDRGDDSDSDAYNAVARTLPPSPRPAAGDLSSFTALRSFVDRTQGAAGPEAHLRARWVANADGTVARPWAPAPPVLQAMSGAMQAAYKAYAPERIRVRALAIYAAPESASDMMRPWYDAADPAVGERVTTLYRLTRERFAAHAKWFQGFAENGRVSELAGAHHLFISHAAEVLEQVNAFASSLQTR